MVQVPVGLVAVFAGMLPEKLLVQGILIHDAVFAVLDADGVPDGGDDRFGMGLHFPGFRKGRGQLIQGMLPLAFMPGKETAQQP